ncbi:MAG: ABC transporter ATP-binding protein [Kiritimatiellae bacterium]|nr:ABC transporter ATP-binding protein [Kiritimatiellia bacterium]
MNIITTQSLTIKFSRVVAVDHLDLTVPEGNIFALLGPNGAGKTTTIKLLMNLIEPTGGISEVLGVTSGKLGPKELAQIGYVSENQELYDWMTVRQLMAFCKPLYPTWDETFCGKLIHLFDLPLDRRISNFSRGMKIKSTFLISLAYRPRLLVLDEPFTGLDPLVRDELIRGILELTTAEHWTVFISSHDLYEVEMLADMVGLLDRGKLKLVEPLDALQTRFRKMTVTLSSPLTRLPDFPIAWLQAKYENRIVTFINSAYEEQSVNDNIRRIFPDCANIEASGMTLREIFIALTQSYKIDV